AADVVTSAADVVTSAADVVTSAADVVLTNRHKSRLKASYFWENILQIVHPD
ncbi:MAG: hypothetical protein HY360_06405, partial [Verrucomicrobia bacterium]|nr:hypothetical protein [Verrucomicrobiota bacterium]